MLRDLHQHKKELQIQVENKVVNKEVHVIVKEDQVEILAENEKNHLHVLMEDQIEIEKNHLHTLLVSLIKLMEKEINTNLLLIEVIIQIQEEHLHLEVVHNETVKTITNKKDRNIFFI